MSVATDALPSSKPTLFLGAIGLGVLGLLVAVNKKLSKILTQVGQVKLLNHPDFDPRTGEFDIEED